MPLSDEKFNELLKKIDEKKSVKKSSNIMSEAEFRALLSKAKTFKVSKDNKIKFEKVTKAKKKKNQDRIEDYKERIGWYERLMETFQPQKETIIREVTKKRKITVAEIDGLPEVIKKLDRKLDQYLENSLYQGGPGIIFHDNSLSGSGVPGDPLKVASTGAAGFTYANELVAGSGTTFTLAHTPTNSGAMLLFGGGSALIQGVDYTITGSVITMTNGYSAGQVVAFYS